MSAGPAQSAALRPVAAHVVRSYLPRSETFTYTQIRSLRRYRAAVCAWLLEDPEAFPWDPVIEVAPDAPLAVRSARHLRARAAGAANAFEHRLAGVSQAAGARVLHAHFGWMGIASLYASRRLRLPLVTTFHANDIVARRDDLDRGYPSLFAGGTLFTAVGPTMAHLLQQRGAPADRIRVVKLGIDLERVRFAPAAEDSPPVLLQVGRLVAKKGVETSLRAFARARPLLGSGSGGSGGSGSGELWIVGDGPLRGQLERLAADLGVADGVRFLGALDHGSTLGLMRRAHIGLQPSVTAPDGDIEGTPTVLLEMQAAGVPVIASTHADIPAIVAHPQDLVAEADPEALAEAIVRLASLTASERRRRALAARRFVESEHSLAAAATAIERAYDEAVTIGGPA
jgi:colanic acid/amylovoran biosynthesis glycosyltransferase